MEGRTVCATLKNNEDYCFSQEVTVSRESILLVKGSITLQYDLLFCASSFPPNLSLFVSDHDHHNHPFPLVTKKIPLTFKCTTILNYTFLSSNNTTSGLANLTQGIQQDIVMKYITNTFNTLDNYTKILLETPEISDLFSWLMPYKWDLVIGWLTKDYLYFHLFFSFSLC